MALVFAVGEEEEQRPTGTAYDDPRTEIEGWNSTISTP